LWFGGHDARSLVPIIAARGNRCWSYRRGKSLSESSNAI
jgi:hypothetical protein